MSLKAIQLLFFIFFVNETVALSFECIYSNSTWDLVGTLYSCLPSKVWDFNEPKIKFVNGSHTNGRNHSNVNGLVFRGTHFQELKYFPEDILSHFPNNLQVRIDGDNDISKISSSNLQTLQNLTFFGFGKSKITSIPSDFFKFNPKLRVIEFFSNNFLSQIGENLLGNLTQLQVVRFKSNRCLNVTASTSQEIRQLNQYLHIQCPPNSVSSTTISTTKQSTSTVISTSTPLPLNTSTIGTTTSNSAIHNQCKILFFGIILIFSMEKFLFILN
jgi:hypothetical protein